MLSAELSKQLAQRENIKLNSASQRVSRSKDFLQFSGFFKSGQSFCYLPKQIKEEDFLQILTEAMFEGGRKYWYTFNALRMHGGLVSKKYLECYTNYPILPLKKHIPFAEIIQKFIKEGLIIVNGDDYMFSPKINKEIPNALLHRTIELIKDTVLNDFSLLVKNTGMVSYNTGELFGEFAKFRWAYRGLSPLIGLRQEKKFGYILADILLGKPFYKNDVLFIVEKINHILSFKKGSRFIPFIIIDNMSKEALHMLKEHGIGLGFIDELFGQKYAETLREVLAILNNAGASLKSNPEKFLELIKELKKYNEGLANNIRGTLFEFLIGHIHNKYCHSIDMGKDIFSESGKHNMDVLAIYNDKIVIAECKALKGLVDYEIIDKWLSKKIPAFRAWVLKQDTLKEKKIEFEFWSTSGFTQEAIEMLKEAKDDTRRYRVDFFDGKDLRQKVIQMRNKKLKEALDDYFLKTTV